MTYDNYREIPLKIFIKVLNDDEKLKSLLPDISIDEWKTFKEEFEAENPTDVIDFKLEKQQEVMSPSAKLQLYKMVVQFSLVAPESWEKLFDSAGINRKETLLASIEYVNTLIAKEQVRFNIAEAEFKKLMKELPEEEEGEGNIFDVISSLSAVTGNRLDYNTSTIGELLAEQKLAERISKKHDSDG